MRDDKVLGSTVRIDLTTHNSTGALVAPSTAFASDGSDFRVYKDGSATQKTSVNGITVTSPFDSIVGKHLVEIDTSNSTGDSGFWAAGSEYRVEINSAKTVGGIVQSGVVVGRFTLVAAGVLRPTVDGRTLDVSATGEAGVDLANVGSPTTTLNLSGLTIKNTTDVKAIVDLIYTVVQLTDSSVSTMSIDTRNAILNRVLAGNHVTAGTVGLLLQFLDALISSRLAPTVAGRTLNVSAAGLGEAVLDAATLALINDIPTNAELATALTGMATAANLTALKTVADKIATVIYGTVTGAGTATEVFTGAGYTVTVTVDASGNRSAVVIT